MNTSIIRKTIAGAGAVAATAVVAPSSWASNAADYPAIAGTTASKDFTGLREFMSGGVVNNSGANKEWLIPIDMHHQQCNQSQGCNLWATFRGSSTTTGCVWGYYLNDFGAVTNTVGPRCNNATLSTVKIGGVVTSSDNLLVKVTLPTGATPGAVTSVKAMGNLGDWAEYGIGAIQGSTALFDWSNWREYGAGGVRNTATTRREWLIAVPSADPDGAGATFVGGAGGSTCVIAYGVNVDGTLASGSSEICHTSAQFGFEDLGHPAQPNTLYVVKLAGASSTGALDGGGIATVRY